MRRLLRCSGCTIGTIVEVFRCGWFDAVCEPFLGEARARASEGDGASQSVLVAEIDGEARWRAISERWANTRPGFGSLTLCRAASCALEGIAMATNSGVPGQLDTRKGYWTGRVLSDEELAEHNRIRDEGIAGRRRG